MFMSSRNFRGYSENCWGITASDGPGPAYLKIEGVERCFEDYTAPASLGGVRYRFAKLA